VTKKVLILGVNGFIGANLTKYILQNKDWEVYGMDLSSHKLGDALSNKRCHFTEGDITINKDWVEYHVKKCDVVLPLVAIATPATYVTDPLKVFELDFEANLPVIRHSVKYQKRVVFPSTSEVYGMSPDEEFDEETSPLMQGPIAKERWIYSCCKQLLDRVIYAYGNHDDLQFTLFRPFNWIGPLQDDIYNLKEGGSRVVTQFMSNIMQGKDLQLVDGGGQRRSFIFIDDAVDALTRIIENKDDCAKGRIFNIGNPANNASIAEVANLILSYAKTYPKYKDVANKVKIISTSADKYYGSGYQDVKSRVPSIKNAQKYLGWNPKTSITDALKKTVNFYFGEN
jgi:nucleoside-diphosphate-sugar epimerase